MKLCIDCAHHRKEWFSGMGADVRMDTCNICVRMNPVDGSVNRPLCEQARNDHRCGPNGSKWSPIETLPNAMRERV